jgi:hypothetical protein
MFVTDGVARRYRRDEVKAVGPGCGREARLVVDDEAPEYGCELKASPLGDRWGPALVAGNAGVKLSTALGVGDGSAAASQRGLALPGSTAGMQTRRRSSRWCSTLGHVVGSA